MNTKCHKKKLKQLDMFKDYQSKIRSIRSVLCVFVEWMTGVIFITCFRSGDKCRRHDGLYMYVCIRICMCLRLVLLLIFLDTSLMIEMHWLLNLFWDECKWRMKRPWCCNVLYESCIAYLEYMEHIVVMQIKWNCTMPFFSKLLWLTSRVS